MKDQFSYYDLLAHLVPGTIFLALLLLVANLLNLKIPLDLSNLSEFGIGLAFVYAFGHILQALSSFSEKAYDYLWGGKPSVRLLSAETKYYTDTHRKKLLEAFANYFDIDKQPNTPSDYQQIFRQCMAIVNKQGLGRVEVFNAVYAFHRVMLTTTLLSSILLTVISFTTYKGVVELAFQIYNALIFLTILSIVLAIIEFFRTKQRGYYYATEVINMAYLAIKKDKTN